MGRNRLFIFSSEYPFGNQETFLESEIEVLCNDFDITIVPRKVLSSSKRELPENVRLDLDLARSFSKKRFQKRFAFLNLFFFYALLYHIKNLSTIQAVKRIAAFVSEYCQVNYFLKDKKFNKGDILYSYWLNGVAYSLSKSKCTINVARAHRYDVYEDLYNPKFMVFRAQTIKNLNKIFFISESGLQHLSQRYSTSEKFVLSKLGTFFNGEFFFKNHKKNNLLKIVSISNMFPIKRVDLIVERLNQFSKMYPDMQVKWDHFGDGPEMEKIEDMLRNTPENFESTLYGRVSNLEIHKALKENDYDVLINLSTSEGLPVSMMEASSYGIPILATDVGGVSEIVSGVAGVLIEKRVYLHEFIQALLLIKKSIDMGYMNKDSIHDFWRENFSAKVNYKYFADYLLHLSSNLELKKGN